MPARIDPEIASVAALVGDPSRAAILVALGAGQSASAGELARRAGVSPATASGHLDKLFRAKLVAVAVQGRHHHYRLAGPEVAQALEALAVLARPAPSLTGAHREAAQALRFARTCYDHLAGRLGVEIAHALCRRAYLREGDDGYAVTAAGWAWLATLGVRRDALGESRRPLTRRCLDWSERRYHLAGAVGAALTRGLLDHGFVVRLRQSRAVRLTDRGRIELRRQLGPTVA